MDHTSVLLPNSPPFAPPDTVAAPGADGVIHVCTEDRSFGTITIGRGTYFEAGYRFMMWNQNEAISVGRFCSVAPNVTIVTGGNHRADGAATWPFDAYYQMGGGQKNYQSTRNTLIGHDVWLGDSTYVAGGAQIGNGAVIGARSVVRGVVPPYAVCFGNPAQVVRYRFSKDIIAALTEIAWWNWDWNTVIENREWFYRPIAEFVQQFGPKA